MKNKPVVCILIYIVATVSAIAEDRPNRSATNAVIRPIVTALDHLTVLEYDEPVAMAAAGSPVFQIERQDNKVFIKPAKTGITTNLFVWTASNQRFGYELTVGDVTKMDASIHETRLVSTPVADSAVQIEKIADPLITRTILTAKPIEATDIKPSRTSRIELKVEQVFFTPKTLYIQYRLENLGIQPYRISTPTVVELAVQHPHMNPISVRGKQIDKKLLEQLGDVREVPIAVVHCDNASPDVEPRMHQQGVVAIQRKAEDLGTKVFQLAFDAEVKATFVF